MSLKRRGFGSMDKDKLRELAVRAGRRAHDLGRAHVWTAAEASAAGKKSAALRKVRQTDLHRDLLTFLAGADPIEEP